MAAFGLGAANLAVMAQPQPAAAIVQPGVDINSLDMVPVRTWGVSGQNPLDTQTQSLDVLVWDFAQIGNRMFVGGAFLNVQENKTSTPISQPYLAAFDVDTGDWISTWTPDIDRAVYTLDVLPTGSLLVGGEFENVNGQSREGLVAIDPLTGAIDPSFAGSVERPWSTSRAVVRDLKIDGDQIYVAGNFSHLKGIGGSRTRVYKAGRFASPNAVLDAAWKPQVTGSGIWGIDTDPGRNEVHMTGYFTAVNGEANTGHFHTVDGTTGATVGGKIELPRNYPASQLEIFDVVTGNDKVFTIGEQHVVQVLNADDQQMVGYHTTGQSNDSFAWQGGFAGGAFQAGERIGDIVFAGCHCTYSVRNGFVNHYSSFDDQRTPHRLVMAYDATTGELLDQFMPDINSPRDGTWAIASDTNGCLYVGGDFHVGGVDSGKSRWLGGFAKLCGDDEQPPPPPPGGDNLIDAQGSWKYDDTGADLGTAWRNPGYNDAAWATGDAELGFGDGDENTVMADGNVTYYARTTFEHTGANPASLNLGLKADDGAVVYLNGTEIYRDNMPAGAITAQTKAAGWRTGAEEQIMQHIVSSSALVQGTNTIAVEIHNIWSGNADLGFDLELSESDEAGPVDPGEDLVAVGSTWNYANSAAGEPANWKAGLNGQSGAAELGFGEGGEATDVGFGQEAYYFTQNFDVADVAAINQLTLTMLIDDGAVVYINGVEVQRYNMPAGAVGPRTRPLNWIGTNDEVYKDYVISKDALTNGTNTIAVEVHNFWPGNADLSFDLALAAE